MSIQLVNVVLTVKGRLTWCLEYARMVFGAPVVEKTAWEAWEATKFKHLDRDLPDAAVPVWFEHWGTLNGIYKNWGHVVVWIPGVGFYSSPHKKGTDYAILKTIEEVERLYKCKFVGWSEDISNVRVAKQGDLMDKKQAQETSLYARLLQHLTVEDANKYAPSDVPYLEKDLNNVPKLLKDLYNSKEWKDANHKAAHYDADVQAAYERGKAEAGDGEFVPVGQLFVKKG